MLPQNESKDIDYIEIDPIEQIGHTCKVTALSCLDQYWAKQVGFSPLYVHKNSSGYYNSPEKQKISLRQIAKLYGSCQGEILEINQLEKLIAAIGYQSKTVHCDTLETFAKTVQENMQSKQPILCFFSVNKVTRLPGFEDFNHDDPVEHACLISGYSEVTGQVRITHSGQHYFCPLQDLYRSMQTLPEERRTEYYKNVKSRMPGRKYDIVQRENQIGRRGRVSLTPASGGTGFKNKVIVLEKPDLETMQVFREKMMTTVIENAPASSSKKKRKASVTERKKRTKKRERVVEDAAAAAVPATVSVSPEAEVLIPVDVLALAWQQLMQQILINQAQQLLAEAFLNANANPLQFNSIFRSDLLQENKDDNTNPQQALQNNLPSFQLGLNLPR